MGINDLKVGSVIMMNNDPFVVMEMNHLNMQQRAAVMQTKIKNLRTGQVLDRNFKGSDDFEEANLEKRDAVFIYQAKGDYWFHEEGKPAARFSLSADILGSRAKFLKPNMVITSLILTDEDDNETTVNVDLPMKADYKVIEAPPVMRGNTASGGNKVVTIEGGAQINTPMFIETGDVIKVNTSTETYVERIGKK
jgi:elongation factor P